MPTSSSPETCRAAIAAKITGQMAIKSLKTFPKPEQPGTLDRAKHKAIAIKPGKEAIIMP